MRYWANLVFLVCLLYITPQGAYAQKTGQVRLDSLIQLSQTMQDDTAKCRVLINISRGYIGIDVGKGIVYAQQLMVLSERLSWKEGVAIANCILGSHYIAKSDYPKALEYEMRSLQMGEQYNYTNVRIQALEYIAAVYALQRNYDKALQYQLIALKLTEGLTEKEGRRQNLSHIFGNVVFVYFKMHKYDEALNYAQKALKLSQEANDKKSIALNMGNIANVLQIKKEYAQALNYDNEALKLYEEIGDKYGAARNLGNIGGLYLYIVLDTEHVTATSAEIPGGKAARLALSIAYLQKAIDASKAMGYMDAAIDFTQNISEAYRQAGNYEAALKYAEEYYNIKDSLFSKAKAEKIKQLEDKQALDIKEKDIQLAQLEVAKKKNERVFYIAGICFLLLAAIVMLRYIRALSAEKTKSDDLAGSRQLLLQQKDVLMKEIHHRVKNNLEVISNLLELQATGLNDATAIAAMEVGQSRIRAIGLLHQKLYQEDDVTSIEFSGFVRELYTQVAEVF
jgi:two-component sensor histidine kinase